MWSVFFLMAASSALGLGLYYSPLWREEDEVRRDYWNEPLIQKRGWSVSILLWVIAFFLLLFVFVPPAKAGPYGYRVDRCAELYVVRNRFYHDRGLCFTRPSAIRLFPSNPRTCRYASGEDFPISASEKAAIDAIVAEERLLGCPRI